MNVGRAIALLAAATAAAAVAAEAASEPDPQRRRPLKETWPWYHSAGEIHEGLSGLVGQCGGADLDVSQRSELNAGSAAGQVVQLDVLHISRQSQQPKIRAMLIFGEHARELISPESAFHFVQTLCGNGPEAARASRVLESVSFTIVPNANPISRRKVEDGYYCKRTNEDGVDLNRNFGDAHRVATGDEPGNEMNPGPSGFSEPETRILKELIDDERPEIYISVHSGAYLLGTPFGYTQGRTPDTEASMMEVLRPISEKYCSGDCPYGNLAGLINYENPGCDIDYVAEQAKSPYVFTWEIYVGEIFRQRYIDEARMQRSERGGRSGGGASDGALSAGLSLAEEQRATHLRRKKAQLRGALERESGPEASELVDSCIDQFNPQTQEETESVVSRWTSAYLELCEEVTARKRGTSDGAPTDAGTPAAAPSPSPPPLSLVLGSAEQPPGVEPGGGTWPALEALERGD